MKLILEYLKKQKKIYSNFNDIINSVDNTFYNKTANDDVQAVNNTNNLTINDLLPAYLTRCHRRQPPFYGEPPLQPLR